MCILQCCFYIQVQMLTFQCKVFEFHMSTCYKYTQRLSTDGSLAVTIELCCQLIRRQVTYVVADNPLSPSPSPSYIFCCDIKITVINLLSKSIYSFQCVSKQELNNNPNVTLCHLMLVHCWTPIMSNDDLMRKCITDFIVKSEESVRHASSTLKIQKENGVNF